MYTFTQLAPAKICHAAAFHCNTQLADGMLELDGSQGEGGGQILRTALALSCHLGTPFVITRIRANRAKPGLRRQHLTAVQAAAAICGASVHGADIGSSSLTFEPGGVMPGQYTFSVGTAGSATLVLQTVLPPLVLAKEPSHLILEGGTHNPNAPPFEFIDRVFLPLLNRMGPRVRATLHRHGFVPAGGGRIEVEITPAPALSPLTLTSRGPLRHTEAMAVVANLPPSIAERELAVLRNGLHWPDSAYRLLTVPSDGPGNIVLVTVMSEHVTELLCAFGERGVKAEQVATSALLQTRHYLNGEPAVGEHTADQLLLPLALAGGGEYTTVQPTRHFFTNCAVIQAFLHSTVTTTDLGNKVFNVKLNPNSPPQRL